MFKKLHYQSLLIGNKLLRTLHLISKENFRTRRNRYRSLLSLNIPEASRLIETFTQNVTGNTRAPRILLITPDCSFTGAPLVLLKVARILKKHGYAPSVISMTDGPLKETFVKEGFPFSLLKNIDVLPETLLTSLCKPFDACICNTVLTHAAARRLQNILPTLLYIHEAKNLYDHIQMDPEIKNSLAAVKNILTPSEYSARFINEFTKSEINICHNSADDSYKETSRKENTAVKFTIIGAMSLRKGIDVCCAAFAKLPEGSAELHVIGNITDSAAPTYEQYKKYPNIFWHSAISDQIQKFETFREMDVFLVPSRDESCSLVVLEATMLGKPLIISSNVGAAYLIEEGKNGFITSTGNIDDLSEKMLWMTKHADKLDQMGALSRKLFLQTSTNDVYEQNFINVINKVFPKNQKV